MFLTALDLEAVTARPDWWAVTRPLVWQDHDGTKITVPPGFLTDLASIPRVFRNIPLLDPDGLSRRPGVLHDWLYVAVRQHGKDWCDQHLRSALIADGMSAEGAETYYLGVSDFGAFAWAQTGMSVAARFRSPEEFEAWKSTQS